MSHTHWWHYAIDARITCSAATLSMELDALQQSNQSPRSRQSLSILPGLGWTYLSREALARAKAQMDAESTGVRDELGFLTIHQRYADLFFPGTSVLHGRARYALFVPWLFEDLAGFDGATAKRELQARECQLAGRLIESGSQQVIGGTVFPRAASQPPSTVYWNALATWGILRSRGSTPTRAQVHQMLRNNRSRLDDDGQPLLALDPPFVPLPDRPQGWRGGPIDLQLTRAEADFLHDRLAQLLSSKNGELSLLARLVKTRAPAPDDMWAAETLAIAGHQAPMLLRARQAASLAGLGRAVYDALLEHLVRGHDKGAAIDERHEHLKNIILEHMEPAARLDVDALEEHVGSLPRPLRELVIATRAWAAAGSTNPLPLLEIYTQAEARKGARARLAMTRDGRARREEWARDNHSKAQPLHFRWHNVSMLLNDLANAS